MIPENEPYRYDITRIQPGRPTVLLLQIGIGAFNSARNYRFGGIKTAWRRGCGTGTRTGTGSFLIPRMFASGINCRGIEANDNYDQRQYNHNSFGHFHNTCLLNITKSRRELFLSSPEIKPFLSKYHATEFTVAIPATRILLIINTFVKIKCHLTQFLRQ